MANINFIQSDNGGGEQDEKKNKDEQKIKWSDSEKNKSFFGNDAGGGLPEQDKGKGKISNLFSFLKKKRVSLEEKDFFESKEQFNHSREEVLRVIKEHEHEKVVNGAGGENNNFYSIFFPLYVNYGS